MCVTPSRGGGRPESVPVLRHCGRGSAGARGVSPVERTTVKPRSPIARRRKTDINKTLASAERRAQLHAADVAGERCSPVLLHFTGAQLRWLPWTSRVTVA